LGEGYNWHLYACPLFCGLKKTNSALVSGMRNVNHLQFRDRRV
jgi:hypothetical protein